MGPLGLGFMLGSQSDLAYVDQRLLQNWAGSKHWKFRATKSQQGTILIICTVRIIYHYLSPLVITANQCQSISRLLCCCLSLCLLCRSTACVVLSLALFFESQHATLSGLYASMRPEVHDV